jgi:SAM-dependent methyltransferase
VESSSGAADGVDVERPSAARVYDYYLGGSHNFRVDREMARRAIKMWPALPQIMQANRAFLRRVVRYVVEQGVTQFLDIGSGIPTVGNVHEVAQQATPDARVVYVDIDPVAVAHSRAILADDERTEVVHADVRDVGAVLQDPRTVRLLDLSQPVGVLMIALLHFVPDESDPAAVIAQYRDALAPGSYLAVSHASYEGQPDQAGPHTGLYERTGTPMTMRSRDEVGGLLDGFEMVEPGVVFLPLWRPEPGPVYEHPEWTTGFAAVGRRGER